MLCLAGNRACFKKNSSLHISTEIYFLRDIIHLKHSIFLAFLKLFTASVGITPYFFQNLVKNFHFLPQKFLWPFLIIFPPHHPLFLPKSRENFSFIPQKFLWPFLVIFPPRHLLFLYVFVIHHCTAFHHYTFSFIAAHFVHHCTLKQALAGKP